MTVVGDLDRRRVHYLRCCGHVPRRPHPGRHADPEPDVYWWGRYCRRPWAKSLGADVRFAYRCQAQRCERQRFARDICYDDYGVSAHIFEDDSRPTTLKQRFRASGKTLLRVSHLRQHEVNRDFMARKLADTIKAPLSQDTDLLIFSDFNYGCLPQSPGC